LNRRECYTNKKIKEIIDGDTNVSLDLFQNEYKINIKFKCYFQEIYDFSILFDDWGGANLNSFLFPDSNEGNRKLKLEIQLMHHKSAKVKTKHSLMNEY